MSEKQKVILPVVSEGAIKLPTDKFHVSYSEIMDWFDCSYRHKLKHIDKIDKDGPSEHTEFGGIIHDAIEKYLIGESPLDPEVTGQKVIEALKALPNFKEDPALWAAAVKPIFDEFPGFMDENFKNFKIVAAEQALMETLEKKQDRFFKGFIDFVLKCDKYDMRKKDPVAEEVYYIIDWKTTSWGWTGDKKRDPMKQMQLVLYKHFWCVKNNVPLDKVKCAWVLLKRDAKPGNHIEIVPVSVGEKAIEKALQMVYAMMGSMEKKIFTKNRNSCRFCPYLNTEHCT